MQTKGWNTDHLFVGRSKYTNEKNAHRVSIDGCVYRFAMDAEGQWWMLAAGTVNRAELGKHLF